MADEAGPADIAPTTAKRPPRVAMTVAEKKQKIVDKRVAAKEAEDDAVAASWVRIPQNADGAYTTECFIIPNELPPEAAFMSFKQRSVHGLSYADIFFKFINQEVIDLLFDAYPEEKLRFKMRQSDGKVGHSGGMRLCQGYMWQVIALTVRSNNWHIQ